MIRGGGFGQGRGGFLLGGGGRWVGYKVVFYDILILILDIVLG